MSLFHFAGFNWLLFWGSIGFLTVFVSLFGGKERANYLRIIAGSTLFTLVWLTGLYNSGKAHEWLFVGMLALFCVFLLIANAMKSCKLSFLETVKLMGRLVSSGFRDDREIDLLEMPSPKDRRATNKLRIARVEALTPAPGQRRELEDQYHELYSFWGNCSQGRFMRFWTLFAEALLKSDNLKAAVADNTTARNILANIALLYEQDSKDYRRFQSLSEEARRAADFFSDDSPARHAMLAASAASYVATFALSDWGHKKAGQACREAVLAVGNIAFADALMSHLIGLEASLGPSHPRRAIAIAVAA